LFDIQSFRLRYPEFEAVEDALVELFATDAVVVMGSDPKHWCNGNGSYEIAQAHLVAHFIQLREAQQAATNSGVASSATSGPITSKSVHGVSVTYRQPDTKLSDDDAYYLKTPYGELYLQVKRQCFGGAVALVAAGTGCGHAGLYPSPGAKLRG